MQTNCIYEEVEALQEYRTINSNKYWFQLYQVKAAIIEKTSLWN